MTDDRWNAEAVARLLRLLADRLEEHLEGEELAFESLGDALDASGFSPDDIQSVAIALRQLATVRGDADDGWLAEGVVPGPGATRVPSAEERDVLSPEAWGYLEGLRARGTLDSRQLERVFEALLDSGARPVHVEMARDAAARVVLDQTNEDEGIHGDVEVAH